MADKEVYIGSVGPLLYDDSDVYEGTSEAVRAIYSPDGEGKLKKLEVSDAPVNSSDVVRKADLSSGILNPAIQDVTASRAIGTIYQNTSPYWMIVMVSAELTV